MSITRTAMVDDDGSGTTGTILNNAWKQELYNQIDALGVGLPAVSGTWTPNDASGAGLIFTLYNARYWTIDKLVVVTAAFSYPATANSGPAKIGGLPFPNGAGYGGFYSANAPLAVTYKLDPGVSFFTPQSTTAVGLTNAMMSGAGLTIVGVYLKA
jgi:hypothetical protein